MKKTTQATSVFYPPVVAVLGHVDHGKTTLLDVIRKTSIAESEHGGITQKIGATSVETLHEGQKQSITLIDTPGHEAFFKMRGRGTLAADIGILVVSSSDGVMPQTKESIQLLLEAKIPFIVALTKSDLPNKNVEKVKQQLVRENVMLEGLGGDIPFIEVSAKENKNIKELLELILLLKDLHADLFADKSENASLKAIVIESKLDNKIGAKATVVIKDGTISIKDELICNGISARVRMLLNDKGEQIKKATVGEAVEILGFEKAPAVGGTVGRKGEEKIIPKAPDLAEEKIDLDLATVIDPMAIFATPDVRGNLALVLCADTEGSLEAIVNALPEKVRIVVKKTGEVSSADILLAKSTSAIVLSFNIKLKNELIRLAQQEKVLLKNYTIIYEMIDEIRDVLEGKQLALEEKIYGKARVLASFPFEKTFVAGVIVLEGRIAKGDKVRLIRGEEVVGEATLFSLRMGKDQISKVEKGTEAGVILQPLLDFSVGDVLLCHS